MSSTSSSESTSRNSNRKKKSSRDVDRPRGRSEERREDSTRNTVTPREKSRRQRSPSPSQERSDSDGDESTVYDEDEEESVKSTKKSNRHNLSPKATASQREREVADRQQHALNMGKVTVKDLRKKVREVEQENANLQGRLADVDKEVLSLQEAYDELKLKYDSAIRLATGKKSRKDDPRYNLSQANWISRVTKRDLWRVVKFITGDDMLHKVSVHILDRYGPEKLRFNDDDDVDSKEYKNKVILRQEWLSMYCHDIRESLNGQRSYVQSQQKHQATWWQRGRLDEKAAHPPGHAPPEGFLELPSVEDVWKAVMREEDDEDDDSEERKTYLRNVLDWWVIGHLGACAGSKYWGAKAHRTECVSTHMMIDDDGTEKQGVPPGTEAMAFIMYENCHEKWREIHKWKEVEKMTSDVPKYSSRRHEETKRWYTKWSDPSGGQDLYGGWHSDGLKEFERIKKIIAKARKDHAEDFRVVEEGIVKRAAAKYQAEQKAKKGLSDEDETEKPPQKKKRKKRSRNDDVEMEVNFDDF